MRAFSGLRLAFAAVFVLAVPAARTLVAAPPGWLSECAALPTPDNAAGAPALVLLDQSSVRIDAKGRLTTSRRYAVRILDASGERYALASIAYLAGRDSVKGLGAWLLRDGKELKLAKSKARPWSDVALDEDAVFSEYRAKAFSYADLAAPGDVFGYEATSEGDELFIDQTRLWYSSLPTLIERYDLTIPPGWTLTARMTGDRPPTENRSADGLAWSWVLRDTPYRPSEPYADDVRWFDARLVTSIQRPPAAGPAGPVSFSRWSDVAAWTLGFSSGQCDRDPALAEMVGRLTAGIEDPLGRMRAISRHVQALRYVSISRDIGIGFGYRPRKATEVHAKGWGDCKDKANLMCAMLRELGITAYLASANLGYGRTIAAEWPSPRQFNHAIVAIPVDDSVDLPAVVETTRFGRVLFFDATDPVSMLGDLSIGLQGTPAFILAEGSDELTILPRLAAEQNRRLERRFELTLAPAGGVQGTGLYHGRGQTAARLRSILRRRSAKELETWVLESLGAPLRGATLSEVTVNDDPVADVVQIRFELAAPKFCQFLPGNLALVKLDLFSRSGMPAFPKRERMFPVDFDGSQVRETVRLVLPGRFAAEELPAPVDIREPFASYESRVVLADGVLSLERVVTLQDTSVPQADYGRVRQFVGDVAKADKSSALLRVGAP